MVKKMLYRIVNDFEELNINDKREFLKVVTDKVDEVVDSMDNDDVIRMCHEFRIFIYYNQPNKELDYDKVLDSMEYVVKHARSHSKTVMKVNGVMN